ncbi:MAG: helix-turn-helix domain-containing protein [Anaerolineae bacterium]|nr:helix-turn-helix domain-containing protein [Anaerolineae bacterium]
MAFVFDEKPSDSPFVERVWRTQSEDAGSFTSTAVCHWEIVVTKFQGETHFTVRGPETKAKPAPIPADAEFLGIMFKLGTFLPHLPAKKLVDGAVNLPEATNKSFWMNGAAWELPTFENVDTFISRLVHDELLVHDPVVESVLQGHSQAYSVRAVQRHFIEATGLTLKSIQQIERAQRAAALLEQGVPILDTVYEAGYFDQSHLTNSLKRFIGKTPTQIAQPSPSK